MIVQPFVFDVGPLEANLFLCGGRPGGEGFLVDAGVFDESVLARARELGLKVRTILLTHLHHDHVDGAAEYAKRWGAEIVSPAPSGKAPGARIIRPGERVTAAGFEFEVRETSGHTPESISYCCEAERLAFVGDAIFAGAVGGTSADDLHAQEIDCLRRAILTMPDDTELYSGHGPATTVGIERAGNPFLQPGFTRLP